MRARINTLCRQLATLPRSGLRPRNITSTAIGFGLRLLRRICGRVRAKPCGTALVTELASRDRDGRLARKLRAERRPS